MTTITVSPSEIDTMRQCPLKHQLTYGERWTKEPTTDMEARALGTHWHTCLQTHYATLQAGHPLPHAVDLVLRYIESVGNDEARSVLEWMYTGYVEWYQADSEWTVVATELAAEVELPAPVGWPATDLQFRLKVKIDLIVRWRNRIWVVDHKSCKNLPKRLEIDLDDQFGLYYWVATQLGYNVFGAIYAASRKTRLKTKDAPLDERFLRIATSRGRKELDCIANEAWQTAYTAYRGLSDVLAARRAGANVEATRHPQPSQCGWKCDFTEACIAGRKGVDLRDYIHRKGYRQDHSRH